MSLIHLMTSLFDHSSTRALPSSTSPAQSASLAQKTGSTANADATTTSSSSAPAGTITASDFLTLLVTELKNQDPTSDQDPNAYINQLVGVNSLQQLISINQELSTAVTPASSASTSTASASTAETGTASAAFDNAMSAHRGAGATATNGWMEGTAAGVSGTTAAGTAPSLFEPTALDFPTASMREASANPFAPVSRDSLRGKHIETA